jgi:hypothetical protein
LQTYDPGLDPKKHKDVPDDCKVLYPDVVLTVHVYRPYKVKMAMKYYHEHGKHEIVGTFILKNRYNGTLCLRKTSLLNTIERNLDYLTKMLLIMR